MKFKKDYKPSEIEPKWQKVWEKEKIYSPNLDTAKKPAEGEARQGRPFYNLMMFPYLSAEGLHAGNMYAFTGADIYGRYQRMKGNDVFEPIGLDGFGIHSENYALKVGRHPMDQAKMSQSNFYRQLRQTGNSYDWETKLETYDPKYYKWTQWIFIQMFKKGLAYRKKAQVNFCPSCKTVLADEQVVNKSKLPPKARLAKGGKNQKSKTEETVGVCERCETPVEKKNLEQWFFKITDYADRLLDGLTRIDWSEKVKTAQRQWIGRSEGTIVEFRIQNSEFRIEVFTTRPDTLFGATFLVLSPDHPFVSSIPEGKFEPLGPPPGKLEVREYVEEAKRKTETEKRAEGKDKTGVFTGLYAINPVNNEKIPIWIADYVLMDYGTGALFGDAHDERDFAFAKKYGIPLKPTVKTEDAEKDRRILNLEECFTGYGTLFNSGQFSGLSSQEAIEKITEWLNQKGLGGKQITYHLRDWLISRQRYWGPPIPLVFCENCAVKIKNHPFGKLRTKIKNGEFNIGELENPGWIAIPENQLPVLLPKVADWKPKGTGKSPLASVENFVNTTCPNCKGPAKRETDVSDTFLDSSWYFFRYPSLRSARLGQVPFDQEITKKWLPVSMYIGGAEHSVLHLLYTRFVTMFFKDLGLISFEEPFKRFYAHGLLIKEGAKMSKSKGNVVVPDKYIQKFGADAMRCYLMFLGPFSQGGDFRDAGIEGMHKFLKRVWRLASKWKMANGKWQMENNEKRMMHKAIGKVTEDVENLRYNTAIAALMEWYNFLSDRKEISQEESETFLKLLAPFAPHMTEELYQFFRTQNSKLKTQKFKSIHLEEWPKYDPKFLEEEEITIVVQVNGKVRDTLKCQMSNVKCQMSIEQLALSSDKIKKHLNGKKIKKTIYVEGKIINFVID